MVLALRTVAALLLLFSAQAMTPASEANQSLAPSDEASLTLKDINGREQSLSSYHGNIVVLNFWATWCVPCREEMPVLSWAQERYGSRGVQVIGASADEESTQKQIPKFISRLKINFPIWVGATTTDMRRLKLGDVLPATAIIDRDGQIVGRIIGVVDKADLQHRIEWLLGDRSAPAPPTLVNNLEKHQHEHSADDHHDEHGHEGEEEHEHGGVGVEGASTVPS